MPRCWLCWRRSCAVSVTLCPACSHGFCRARQQVLISSLVSRSSDMDAPFGPCCDGGSRRASVSRILTRRAERATAVRGMRSRFRERRHVSPITIRRPRFSTRWPATAWLRMPTRRRISCATPCATSTTTRFRRLREAYCRAGFAKRDYAGHVIALPRNTRPVGAAGLWIVAGTGEHIRYHAGLRKARVLLPRAAATTWRRGTPLDEPVLYDSRDLVTHAVCVGMTGSGKTGLCLSLIEEAAIDGVPVIAIDPKGDLGNLLLTFPDLSAAEFPPLDRRGRSAARGADARRFAAGRGGPVDARAWPSGGRTAPHRSACATRPSSRSTRRAAAPACRSRSSARSRRRRPRRADDAEALAERAGGTATSLLALAGVDAEPRSREHTLLSTPVRGAWRAGAISISRR